MVGQTVGQYHIQEQLGKGGMGIVYKAHDTRLDRIVALKFLPPHLSADETSKQRFMQEARAASALDHSNICTIHDIGEADDGQLFIVMSFYDGETLKYRLEEGKLPVMDAVRTAHQIACGLARAHEAGIVHRDIKPANIMVTARGEVKILDFGVAKLSQSSELTKTGSTIGTAAYMSPEQARGESVDFRADIWSVGVLLYEMLTGTRPFEGGYEAAMVYAIINQDPPPLSDSVPDLPEGVDDVVQKCLAKIQGDRFAMAEDLVEALDPIAGASGTMTTTTPRMAPATTSEPSTPSLLKVGSSFILASVVVLAIVYAGMIGFGLPDWVFPTGIVLMLLGLPIILYAAHNEGRFDSADEAALRASALTLKKAIWGGFLSMSALAVFSAVYMVMRVMGIGPAATLQSSGALEDNAKLIVAEFENSTSDETLSESVSELLRIDLSQSVAINVMDGSDIVSVLSRMNRKQDAKIDLNTAMEIAAREGAEAVVAGEISQLGRGYVLTARLLAAHDGSELVALRETAEDDGAIIAATDRLSADLRERIGESIKTIRSNEDLDRVTTSSLDALRLYSQGVAAADAGNFERSIELLTHATLRDSTFAMAYRKMAVVYGNSGASPQFVIEAASNAYQLRDRLPARERGLATAYYFAEVDRDRDRKVAAYEALIEQFPDETAALNNVAIDYVANGEFEKAERYARRALAIGSKDLYFDKLIVSLSAQKRWNEVDDVIADFELTHPNHPSLIWHQFATTVARGSYEGADSLVRTSSVNNDIVWKWWDSKFLAHYKSFRGKLAEMETETARTVALNLERGVPSFALDEYVQRARILLDVVGDFDGALRIVEKGLLDIPMGSLHPYSRPYSALIAIFARLGQTDRARQLLDEYQQVVPEGIRNGDLGLHLAVSELLISRGQIESGLETMRRAQTISKCRNCFLFRQGQILERMDSLETAIAVYTRFIDDSDPYSFMFRAPDIAPAYLRLGELHSRMGHTDEAIEAYSKFVDVWQNADSELQPRVAYARDRIGRLLDQSTREPG